MGNANEDTEITAEFRPSTDDEVLDKIFGEKKEPEKEKTEELETDKKENEKKIIEAEIKKAQGKYKEKIVTQVAPFSAFYKAEDYHQEYIHFHPNTGYVAGVSIPEFLEFRKNFKGDFKY